MKDQMFWGLFAEPGLGKTKIILDICTYIREGCKKLKALIVCPNTLVENWADEVEKHSDLSYQLLLGTKKDRLKKLNQPADLYIINYESTRILYPELIKAGFTMLVLDESTAVKNHKSQQSVACYELSHKIPRRYILSGTPIMNSPLDLFAQYRILNPLILGASFYRFRGTYAVMGGYMNKQAVAWRYITQLKQRVFSCATRKTKDECLDLPDKLYQVVKVDLSPLQREVYDKLKQDFIYEVKDIVVTAPIMLTRLMRFSQITAGFTKDVEGVEHAFKDNPKVKWVLEFLADLEPSSKVVIFVRFRKEIDMVSQALRLAGIKTEIVFGDTSDRIEAVRRFNQDPTIRVFLGQIQTTGMGINLTAGSYVIFLTNSYSYGDRIQCEDRCHRIGQTKNVTYIDLLARNTIDIGIHNALRKKESLSSMITGDIIKMI